MSKILCLNTASKTCSVALVSSGLVIDEIRSEEALSHSKLLDPMVKHLCEKNNSPLSSLSALAINAGPGSYTGLRIGSSYAKAICFVMELPLIAIGHLSLAYSKVNCGQSAWVLKFARPGYYYAAYFNALGEIIIEPALYGLEVLRAHPHWNEDCIILLDQESRGIPQNHLIFECFASEMASLAIKSFNKADFESISYFQPAYLQEPFVRKV